MTDQWWPALLSSVVAPQLSDDQLPEAESSGQTVSHSSHSFAFLADFLRKKIDKNWNEAGGRMSCLTFIFHIVLLLFPPADVCDNKKADDTKLVKYL